MTQKKRYCVHCGKNFALPGRMFCEECRLPHFLELSRNMPEDLKEILGSVELGEAAWQIFEKYGIEDEIIILLPDWVFLIAADYKTGSDLVGFLVKEAKLRPEKARALVHEILDLYNFKDEAKMAEGDKYFEKALVLSYNAEGNELDQEILSTINSALELGLYASDEAVARLLRKDVYMRKGRFSEAEAEIKKALQLDPKLGDSLFLHTAYADLSLIYKKRGQLSRAIESLQNAIIELQTLYDPEKERGAIALAYSTLAAFYLAHRNELTSADEQCFLNLQQALEAYPECPDAYLRLGLLHGNKKISKFYEPQKAIEYYKRYLTLMAPTPFDDAETKKIRRGAQEQLALLMEEVETAEEKPKKDKGPKKKGFFKKLFG